jgi:protein-disulfide isomerase
VVEDWASYASVGHRVGPSDAAVTAVVFSDYQCPYCKELNQRLNAYQAKHRDELAVVWRHTPLGTHSHAEPAAKAAICGAEQGRFAQIHDSLFQSTEYVLAERWVELAMNAGVGDTVAFKECLEGPVAGDVIDRDRRAAGELGASGTPLILVNSSEFRGMPRDLERVLSHALRDRR